MVYRVSKNIQKRLLYGVDTRNGNLPTMVALSRTYCRVTEEGFYSSSSDRPEFFLGEKARGCIWVPLSLIGPKRPTYSPSSRGGGKVACMLTGGLY